MTAMIAAVAIAMRLMLMRANNRKVGSTDNDTVEYDIGENEVQVNR